MRNILFLITLLCYSTITVAQELNCDIVVNAQSTGGQNEQVFKTLERQLKEFVNNTAWTTKALKPQERINCSMNIIIDDYDNDSFQATIQVQASRPVYGSTYSTPIYNFNDKNFSFQYLEFQNLVFNPNQYESNLVSVLAFHIYMILGIDADTFQLKGGEDYFQQAFSILNYSQQGNSKGWKREDGSQTRYVLIDNLLSPTFKEFRNVMYEYHLGGLDMMSKKPKVAKQNILNSVMTLKTMNSRRPNSFLLRVFFDAKADEIKDIFSEGPKVNITELVSTLNKIGPTYGSKWRTIKF